MLLSLPPFFFLPLPSLSPSLSLFPSPFPAPSLSPGVHRVDGIFFIKKLSLCHMIGSQSIRAVDTQRQENGKT